MLVYQRVSNKQSIWGIMVKTYVKMVQVCLFHPNPWDPWDPDVASRLLIPRATYTDPEVASVGWSAAELEAAGRAQAWGFLR